MICLLVLSSTLLPCWDFVFPFFATLFDNLVIILQGFSFFVFKIYVIG